MTLLLVATISYCQLPNDDCHTATDAGILTGTQLFTAYTGAQYDTCLQISNAGATTSYPYLYTTATCGNNPATGINTDVWMKFVTYTTFGITGLLPQGETALDTVSITFWKGADCSALQAIARLTYPLGTPGYFYDTIWANSADTIDTFYLQISGLNVTDTGSVYLCITGIAPNTGGGGGCYPANAINDTICSTYRITTTNALTNNNGTASITMLGGNAPFSYLWGDGNTDSARTSLAGGIYRVTITDVNGCAEKDSIAIYGRCSSTLYERHNSIGLYTFATAGNPADEYVWVVDSDTIQQDTLGGSLSYRFDTAGIHTICLATTNHTTLCVTDTCIQVFVENTRYVPLLDSINIWHYTGNGTPVLPSTPTNSRSNDCTPGNSWGWRASKEYTGPDTIINAKTYKPIITQKNQWPIEYCTFGYLREVIDSGKIYFLPADTTQEILLYNFGMNKGDTIFLHFENNELYASGLYRLDSISPFTIEHAISPRRQFFLNSIANPVTPYNRFLWIEGVGNLFELVYPYAYFNNYMGGLFWCQDYNSGILPQILTCYEHNKLEFYNACALNIALNISSWCFNYTDTCNYYNICGGIEDLSDVAAVDVYPNPTHNNVTLKLTVKQSSVFAVRVMDIHGRYISGITQLGHLNEGEHQTEIPLTGLPSGMYFIECSTGEGRIYERVIKQ
jgi:hypothetical protein